jgi:hypothetical protein
MEVVALVLLAAVAVVVAVFGRAPKSGSRRWRPRIVRSRSDQQQRYPRLRAEQGSDRPRDAADQLRVVMRAPFQKQRLMSKGEYDVFRTIETHLRQCGPGFRLMAQTSMGEFLQTSDKDAYLSVNSKRVDMLVIDTFGFPVVAIEHQGGGHYQSDAAARDAVKREALRKAGIEFLEIFDYHKPDDVCRLLGESIARNKPPASPVALPPRQTG